MCDRQPQAAGKVLAPRPSMTRPGRPSRNCCRRSERDAARGAHRLPLRCQQLIALLTETLPCRTAKISAKLGIPVGSIGSTRSRCLDKLRRYPAVAALIDAHAAAARGKLSWQAAAQRDRSMAALNMPCHATNPADQVPDPRPGSIRTGHSVPLSSGQHAGYTRRILGVPRQAGLVVGRDFSEPAPSGASAPVVTCTGTIPSARSLGSAQDSISAGRTPVPGRAVISVSVRCAVRHG